MGTSFIKVSIVDIETGDLIQTVQFPEQEQLIHALHPGWAEQNPNDWWENVQSAIIQSNATKKYDPLKICAIGITYQMHGLVLLNPKKEVLRESIIWCDSRAVEIGEEAYRGLGARYCENHLLNAPGNFTASKLAWVKAHEPEIYSQIDKVMLPGDFIAFKLTQSITTTISALSEGIFWDYKNQCISKELLEYYGFRESFFPAIQPVFSIHGYVEKGIAHKLGIKPGISVAYKAGDQLNNALSLNVMEPGEVAATAGTSGVIYGVSDQLVKDKTARINSFAHVNHTMDHAKIGVLLCINGTGILNSWLKKTLAKNSTYETMNRLAANIPMGSEGLKMLPFGNGAERMLNNRNIGAQFLGLDLNRHQEGHLYRAAQEGIAFAFRYGLNILNENKIQPKSIRVGHANLFLSDVFLDAFVNVTNTPVDLYPTEGSIGAALGAGVGAGSYLDTKAALEHRKPLRTVEPNATAELYNELYNDWEKKLKLFL